MTIVTCCTGLVVLVVTVLFVTFVTFVELMAPGGAPGVIFTWAHVLAHMARTKKITPVIFFMLRSLTRRQQRLSRCHPRILPSEFCRRRPSHQPRPQPKVALEGL